MQIFSYFTHLSFLLIFFIFYFLYFLYSIFSIFYIFPLVPGARVYYTVYYLVTSEMGKAAQEGLEALKIAFGIVLGIAVVLAIPREVFQIRYWEQRKYRFGTLYNTE